MGYVSFQMQGAAAATAAFPGQVPSLVTLPAPFGAGFSGSEPAGFSGSEPTDRKLVAMSRSARSSSATDESNSAS
jgi:hypothetical protein